MTLGRLKSLSLLSLKEDNRPEFLKSMIIKGSFHYYNFFFMLANEVMPDLVVELGTNTGRGALNFRYGYKKAHVITVDIRQPHKDKLSGHSITCLTGDSVKTAILVPDNIDILFIDSLHMYNHVVNEYKTYLPKVKEGGIIIFDDIYLNRLHPEFDRMEQAWNEVNLPKVDLTELHKPAGFGAAIKEIR